MPRPALPEAPSFSVNLTPMIDVVFQLIIFFMLVARFSQEQHIDLILPRVGERSEALVDTERRAVVNVVPEPRRLALGGSYRVGLTSFDESPEGLDALTATLRQMRERQPTLEVFIRAQRTEPYRRVHPAIDAVTRAGVRRFHLVTVPTEGAETAR